MGALGVLDRMCYGWALLVYQTECATDGHSWFIKPNELPMGTLGVLSLLYYWGWALLVYYPSCANGALLVY